jgi:hypothetical protein
MDTTCISCRGSKATLTCDHCQESLCSKCDNFLEANSFPFLEVKPPELSHTHYCAACYFKVIEPALENYNEVMERAKAMYFFFDEQKKPVPVTKRGKVRIYVKDVLDREEAILRLAFIAASQGFTAVIEAKVISKKVRNEGYQKSIWQGEALPVYVDVEKLERYDALSHVKERF